MHGEGGVGDATAGEDSWRASRVRDRALYPRVTRDVNMHSWVYARHGEDRVDDVVCILVNVSSLALPPSLSYSVSNTIRPTIRGNPV